MQKQIKVYTPKSGSALMGAIWKFKEMWEYRDLLMVMVRREIAVRYKQSVLGAAWAMFAPLSMMLIFSFIFTRIVKVQTGNVPYPVFVYAGLLPWTFFQTGLAEGANSLVQNVNLITKVYFPRAIFPLASILAKLVDLLLSSLVMIGLMAYFKYMPHWEALVIPLIFLLQVLFMTGLVLILSVANLFYRDVKMILPVLLMLWMFASNVIYPIPTGSGLAEILGILNPMIPFLDAYRSLLFHGTLDNPESLFIAAAISLAILLVGVLIFERKEYLFAERI